MDFVKWYRRMDYWRSNQRHMWQERTERERLLQYLDTAELDDVDELKSFFSKNRFWYIPYEWALEKNFPKPRVDFDEQKKMYYADWHGKKLYWRRGDRKKDVSKCVRTLSIEQHEKSPHRYNLPVNLKGAVIADVGAAEGCFTLDVIDQISHAYLFECDEAWVEPLNATFAPWKEKVTIVKKFVGNQDDDAFITLDDYFKDKPLDFIKADIEGAELDMLSSGAETLRCKVSCVNVCLYHRDTDEADITSLLRNCGYSCKVNPGYMFFHGSDDPGNWVCRSKNPKDWFRRGVVQAERKLP